MCIRDSINAEYGESCQSTMLSRSRWLLLLLLVMLLVSVAMGRNPGGGGGKKKRRNNRSDKEFRNAFTRCEASASCKATAKDELPRCALVCVSQQCYDQIYGEDELEPGELDHHRRKQYKDCFRALPQNANATQIPGKRR
eukprot:TRINITY_DN49774_c0_g1_i1.p1 TRINITY_DN49774_c0_g1~~TRINITY_DN49774_c0_g1_i1.p1  ORF type:complete len:140 (+),score=26.00 TRINITY_DN49774_c0_g1_i1:123-542(+)